MSTPVATTSEMPTSTSTRFRLEAHVDMDIVYRKSQEISWLRAARSERRRPVWRICSDPLGVRHKNASAAYISSGYESCAHCGAYKPYDVALRLWHSTGQHYTPYSSRSGPLLYRVYIGKATASLQRLFYAKRAQNAGDNLLSPYRSTIGSRRLNFRVRNENGCGPSDKSPASWARLALKNHTHRN